MSQDVSATMNNIEMDVAEAAGTAVLEPEARLSETMNPEFDPETFSVDRYADRLMDDIFMKVEHSLETGLDLPDEKPEPEYIAVQQIKMPDLALPLSLMPESALEEPAQEETQPKTETSSQPQQPDRSLIVLSALALATFAGAAAVVATQWQSYRALYLQVTGQAVPVVATAPVAQSPNIQFATYVQRSLEVLKDQTAINQTSGRVVIAPPPAVLQVPPVLPPTVARTPSVTSSPVPDSLAAAPTPKTVVERIYIPVYQTPSGYMPVDPNVQLSPEVTAAGVLPLSQPPAPQGTVAREPVAIAAVDAASQEAASSGQVDSVQPETNIPFDAEATPQAPQAPIVSTYTLVGLLELGNGSAALVEVNGVTRRLSLGERIGGWSLAEVRDGEAVFRRSGEVRSVFVGQNF